MTDGPRLHRAEDCQPEPEPALPIGPRCRQPLEVRPRPNYTLVVLPMNEADDPEDVKTYAKAWDAIQDLDALAKDPDRLDRLRLAVIEPAWIVIYDAKDNEVRRRPVLRLFPATRSVSWWANLFRRL